MIRRFVIVMLAGLVVVAVVLDRLAAQAAQQAVAVKARQAALLAADPDVHIRGFPFLTQAARGRYTEIDVTTHGIHRGGVRLDTVAARFFGVHVSLSDALAGKVASVPIDRTEGSVLVSYADLNAALAARHVTVSQVGGAVRVSGELPVAGKRVTVAGEATAGVADGRIVISALPSSLQVAGQQVPPALAQTLVPPLSVQVSTGTLPFGLQLRSVQVGDAGITATAIAQGLLVPVPADASHGSGLLGSKPLVPAPAG